MPVGVGVAVLTTAGTLAAAEWVSPAVRTRALSWALVGQPAAWIGGMPLVGLLGERSWRYGWLALPLVAAAVSAGILVASRAGQPPARSRPAGARTALADHTLARWLTSELFANAAWAGTLVYAGALFAESYGTSTKLTGCLLACAAGAYVAGNLTCRRLVRREPRRTLVLLAVSLAITDILFGVVRSDVAPSTALLSSAAFAAGGAHADRERVRPCRSARAPAGPDQPPSRDDAVRLLRRLDRRRRGARPRRLRRARRQAPHDHQRAR